MKYCSHDFQYLMKVGMGRCNKASRLHPFLISSWPPWSEGRNGCKFWSSEVAWLHSEKERERERWIERSMWLLYAVWLCLLPWKYITKQMIKQATAIDVHLTWAVAGYFLTMKISEEALFTTGGSILEHSVCFVQVRPNIRPNINMIKAQTTSNSLSWLLPW